MSLVGSFLKSYCTNLFIIWEVILAISHIFKDAPIVDGFRLLLVSNQGYNVVLIPLTATAFCYDTLMLVNNQEFYLKIKNNKFQRYLIIGILGGLIATDFVLFRVGIIEILVDKFPEGVNNQKIFEFWTGIAYLIIYSAVPMFHYLFLLYLRYHYKIKSEFEHNRFKLDLTRAVFLICMVFDVTLIMTTIQYCHNAVKPC